MVMCGFAKNAVMAMAIWQLGEVKTEDELIIGEDFIKVSLAKDFFNFSI